MKKFAWFTLLILLSACKKDPVIPKAITTVCGTPGWPQGLWNVRYKITGSTTPDSVTWHVNMPNPTTSFYYQKRVHPVLPILDSTQFCGDVRSDVTIFLFDTDTTHIYNCKIFVNNVLSANVTAHCPLSPSDKWLFACAQCQ